MSMPVWGLCRHGLVAASSLALPNGGAFAYPQPSGIQVYNQGATVIRDTAGHTIGIKVPGVAEITRSTDEAANDYAKGYVWQNTALLSGGYKEIAKKQIGSNGWIYCAPDGSRWLVQLSGVLADRPYSITTPLNFNLQVRRFGELLGQPDQYSYPMTISNFGKDDPYMWPGQITTAYFLIATAAPAGHRAVLELATFFSSNTGTSPEDSLEERKVFAFHEFELSGTPGVDFASTVTLLYPNSQVFVDTQPMPTMKGQWYGGWVADGAGWAWYSGATYVENSYSAPIGVLTTGYSSGYKICALWYDANSVAVPVYLHATVDGTLDLPEPAQSHSSSSSWTTQAWLSWGDLETDKITTRGHSAGSYSLPAPPNETAYTNTITDTHVVFDYDPSIPDLSVTTVRDWSDLSAESALPGAATPPSAVSTFGSTGGVGYYGVGRMSNNVISLTHSRVISFGTSGDTYRTIFPPLTPAGQSAGTPVKTISTHPFRYASYNPATGEALWGSESPVCYV